MATITNIEVKSLIALVEQRTGYEVLADSAGGMSTYSDMKTATPGFPRHLIRVNQEMSKHSDYLVALQCAMILNRWTATGPSPRFAVRDAKSKYFTDKIRKDSKLKALPDSAAEAFAARLAQGLLQQLCSTPAEIIAGEMCWKICPGLRQQQIDVVHQNLRDTTAALATRIREQTPAFVFEKNAAMNAAFALWWAGMSGESASIVPFESLGFKVLGQRLLDACMATPAEDEQRTMRATDAWAGILEMATLYEWL